MSKRRHFEEYIYLAGDTHNSAFIGWGGNDEGHFLLVKIRGRQMEVTPIARLGGANSPRTLPIRDVKGNRVESKITLSL